LIWQVLGFGGRPNPLVFARVASFAARSGQALFRTRAADQLGLQTAAPLRLQLYVDDPIAAVAGRASDVTRTIDILTLWWLVLGVPLAWKKGALSWGEHLWIGVLFTPRAGNIVMTLPPSYLTELVELLTPFCKKHGVQPIKTAVKMVGKAGRVSYVVPLAAPFVHGLWGALTAAQRADDSGSREAPPGKCCTRRFAQTASWLRALLVGEDLALFPLERLVSHTRPRDKRVSSDVIEFDASPWGGGAARRRGDRYLDYVVLEWNVSMVPGLAVEPGLPKYQTFWEFIMVLVALLCWGDSFPQEQLHILGDNTEALQTALDLKGRGPMLAISRELSWRKARRKWEFKVGHLPSERNGVADQLSRMAGPDAQTLPHSLKYAARLPPPDLSQVWVASEAS